MDEIIVKLKSAHDKLMCIMLSAQDAVTFSNGIVELRQAIAELESEKKRIEELERSK